MDKVLYIAMSGAEQTMLAQTIHSNNLANANTTGFRADLEQFTSHAVTGTDYPTRIYTINEAPTPDLSKGPMLTTGRDLDVAIRGEGWIAVQGPGGKEAYTRAGDLQVIDGGRLVTGSGYAVLGSGGPIALPPAETIEIARNGNINIRPVGQSAKALASVEQIKLVNPDPINLMKGEDGLFYLKEGEVSPVDPAVLVVNKTLESSNVNPVNELVNIISLARQYEMHVKMMKLAEDNSSITAKVLELG